MTQFSDRRAMIFILAAIIMILLLAGCAPAVTQAPTAAPVSAQESTPTQAAPAPADTQAPSLTVPPTEQSEPTATADEAVEVKVTETPAAAVQPQAQGKNDFSVWCLPANASVTNAKDPLNPPANAKKASYNNNIMDVRNLPSNGCMFVYTFAQAAGDGLKMEMYEAKQSKPFYTVDLQTLKEKPEVAYVLLRHAYITSSPAEFVSFSFVVRDPLGQELRRDQVNLHSFVQSAPAAASGDDEKGGDEDCGCSVTPP